MCLHDMYVKVHVLCTEEDTRGWQTSYSITFQLIPLRQSLTGSRDGLVTSKPWGSSQSPHSAGVSAMHSPAQPCTALHSHAQQCTAFLRVLKLNAGLCANRAYSIKLYVAPLTKSAGVLSEQALHSASPRNLEILHFSTNIPDKLHSLASPLT